MYKLTVSAQGKSALVSGANRGIGRAIVEELISRGAAKVYAGARNIDSLNDLVAKYGERIIPVHLDVTKDDSIKNAANIVDQLDILVNNAGVLKEGSLLEPNARKSLQENMDVNVWGLLNLSNAVKSHFMDKKSSAIVNISSVAGLANMPFGATYSVSKAAVHSITQGMRNEMKPHNTLVVGVYPGPIDTDMTSDFDLDKESPQNVAKSILDGLENGLEDVYPDAMSTQIGAYYATNPKAVEQQFGEMRME